MRLSVSVTDADIHAATPKDWKNSALCLAMMSAGCDWAIVSPTRTWAGYQGRRCEVMLPQTALDFLRREDRNQPRKPFAFTAALLPSGAL